MLLEKLRRKRINSNKSNKELLIMCIPAVLQVFIFAYLPMIGIIIAFKEYIPSKGIWGSEWVGFKNFEFFFKSVDAWRVTRNTIGLNTLFIAINLIVSISLALIFNEIKNKYVLKTYQTIAFFPFFISWVLVGLMLTSMLNNDNGLLNVIIQGLGGEKIMFYSESQYWPVIMTMVHIWKFAGRGAIIYYAIIIGVDKSFFEAAEIDGASKLQSIRYITLPFIRPMVIVLTLLSIGRIMRSDFGEFFFVPRDVKLLYPATDVIDTYIFRALKDFGDFTMSSAVGLFQSVTALILIVGVNKIVKKIDSSEALF